MLDVVDGTGSARRAGARGAGRSSRRRTRRSGNALDGPDISEEEHEVTLTEKRPVVAKETVSVERVKLTMDTEQSEEQISEQVRKERIEADGDVDLTKGQKSRTK